MGLGYSFGFNMQKSVMLKVVQDFRIGDCSSSLFFVPLFEGDTLFVLDGVVAEEVGFHSLHCASSCKTFSV